MNSCLNSYHSRRYVRCFMEVGRIPMHGCFQWDEQFTKQHREHIHMNKTSAQFLPRTQRTWQKSGTNSQTQTHKLSFTPVCVSPFFCFSLGLTSYIYFNYTGVLHLLSNCCQGLERDFGPSTKRSILVTDPGIDCWNVFNVFCLLIRNQISFI